MLCRSLAFLFLAAALSGCELFLGSNGVADAGTDTAADAGDAADARVPDAGPCGNGKIDPGETCDMAIAASSEGACPSTCDDHEACTKDTAIGSGCTASCQFDPITTCRNDDGCCPSGCNALTDTDCPPLKRIFVTSGTYNGNLKALGAAATGLEGADVLCTAAAQGASLSGAWKAWLSDGSQNAIDRIADVGPWQLLGSWAVVFANKDALRGNPSSPIDRDERGIALTNAGVWTATANGTFDGLDCYEWISDRVGDFGNVGTTASTGGWTANDGVYCNGLMHLYCLEQ